MTVEELICYGKQHIHSSYAKILLAETINKNVLELLNYLDYQVPSQEEATYKKSVEAIENGEPLQYALGYVNFYGNKFIVNKNVLIPRFETEELVENTVKYANKYFKDNIDIIDLGCGSGAIGLTLEKHLKNTNIDMIDIDEKALEVARLNAKNLGSKANLFISDMWSNVDKKYDIIISNPPYIKTIEEIEEIVKNNEPKIALYAGIDGLDCYRKIFKNIKSHMKSRCLIALEIGMTQKKDIEEIAKETLGEIRIETKKDLSEKDRMIFIFKNIE